jgi:hypothetical protein
MTREEIISKLALKYGHHMEFIGNGPRGRSIYAETGRDDLATTMTTEHDENGVSIRSLTYGEIADALTED